MTKIFKLLAIALMRFLKTVSASLNTFKCIRCAKTKRPALKKKLTKNMILDI